MQSDKRLEYINIKHIKIHLWSGRGPVPGGLTNSSSSLTFSSFRRLSFLKVYFVNEYSKQWPWMHSHLSKLVDRNSPSLSLSSPPPELCLIIINAIIRTHTIHYCLSISFFLSPSVYVWTPLTPHRCGLGEMDVSLCLSDQCCFCCLQILSGSFLPLYWNLINF